MCVYSMCVSSEFGDAITAFISVNFIACVFALSFVRTFASLALQFNESKTKTDLLHVRCVCVVIEVKSFAFAIFSHVPFFFYSSNPILLYA